MVGVEQVAMTVINWTKPIFWRRFYDSYDRHCKNQLGKVSAEPVAQAERKRHVYPLCAPDRMFNPAIIAKVQEQLGAPFSFNAACNEEGTNALCSRYVTLATFPLVDVAGEALCFCVSPQDCVHFSNTLIVQSGLNLELSDRNKEPDVPC